MSTQNVSTYAAYDPYFAQRINAAVNAAKMNTAVNGALFTPTSTQTASTPQVSEADIAAYRKQIAEIEKLQSESQNGMIVEEEGQKYQVQNDGYIATDGNNDGKISFGQKLKNIGKGALRTFTSMFTDKDGKFSWKQTLKTVAIAGAFIAANALLPGVGSVLLYGGLALGTAGLIKNGVKAAKATTDQEAEQAWQGIGTSGTVVAMSLVGFKQKGAEANVSNATREKGIWNSIKGAWEDLGTGFKNSGKDITTAISDIAQREYGAQVGKNVATKIFNQEDWAALKKLDGKEMRDAFCRNVKNQALERLGGKSKYVENSKKDIDKEIAKLQKEGAKEGISTERSAEIEKEIAQLTKQKDVYDIKTKNSKGNSKIQNKLSEDKSVLKRKQRNYETILKDTENELKALKVQLKEATTKEAKNNIKVLIDAKKLKIENTKAMLSEYQNYDAYLNNRIIKMAFQNFKYQHPTKFGQLWATTKVPAGFSSNTNIVAAEAVSNLTSEAPTLSNLSPEVATEMNEQYQAELAAQKAALEQQYQAALAQQSAAPATGTAAATQSDVTSQMLLQNWANQYRVA